jgi:PAS domain S-box-containing protein
LLSGIVIRDDFGIPMMCTHCGLEISERKEIEEERSRLATAIEQVTDLVIVSEPDGSIRYVNQAFERFTGRQRDQVIGQSISTLLETDQLDMLRFELSHRTGCGEAWKGRLKAPHADGQLHEVEATISPVCDPNGDVINYMALVRDVSREYALEQQLQKAQRLEAIGTLAGGIAHDFNNILYAILGYADLALDDLAEAHPAHDSIQEIVKAGRRASELIKQILTFSRQTDRACSWSCARC